MIYHQIDVDGKTNEGQGDIDYGGLFFGPHFGCRPVKESQDHEGHEVDRTHPVSLDDAKRSGVEVKYRYADGDQGGR